MNGRPRKRAFRWPALTGLLASLGGVAVTLANDPHILGTVAGKLGVSAVLLGAIVNAATKPLRRQDHERDKASA